MKQAAYGTYINGQVVFKEPVPIVERSEVVVVFLDELRPKQKLSDIFSLYGVWEDSLTAQETVEVIRSSRVERADVCL
jgi:hypothetical protein